MPVAAFIGELQHFKNLKPSYLYTCKWAISPFLSDQVTFEVLLYLYHATWADQGFYHGIINTG